jgi:hypothetical protein
MNLKSRWIVFYRHLLIRIQRHSFQAAIAKAAHSRVGNPQFEQPDDMQCKVISSNPAAVDANFPLQTNQKIQDQKLLG